MTVNGNGNSPPKNSPEIAIIGGGIVGLILAAGLHRRAVPVTVYEQASTFRESGAGIGFNMAAKACMEMIDPAVITALRLCGGVSFSSTDPVDPHDYLRWVDGCSPDVEKVSSQETVELALGGWQRLYLKADAGYKGIEGTRRDSFLEELGKLFAPDMIRFNKTLADIQDVGDDAKLVLKFEDGTTAFADAVIGCDGIRSTVRNFILDDGMPPSKPTYAHVQSCRALLPMAEAIDALGKETAAIYHNHIGPGANILHYPVAGGAMVNIAVFIHDAEDWTDVSWTTRDRPRSVLEDAVKDWNPRIKSLISKLPDTIPVLGVFDMHDYPLTRYHNRRICVAGDAAHASSPHHGAGAGMGIEDALCLSSLLAEVSSSVRVGDASTNTALETAFQVFDKMRRRRSQWLVNSSRRVCDLQHSSDLGAANKTVLVDAVFEEIMDRTLKIWQFDFMGMMRESVELYGRTINKLRASSVMK